MILDLISEIQSNFGNLKQGGSSDVKFTTEGNYGVGDMRFSFIDFNITFDFGKHKNLELSSMHFGIGDKLTRNYKVQYNKIEDRIDLGAQYLVPDDITEHDLILGILKFKNKTIASISHELKHAYDFYKKPIRNAGEKVAYHSIEDLMVSVSSLMRFKNMLYYSHVAEETVRNSEIYTLMKLKGITKKEFRIFLSTTTTYEILKFMKDYDYNKFLKETYQNIKGIEMFLEYVNINHDGMNDSEKVETALKKFYEIVSRRRKEFLNVIMTDPHIELMSALAKAMGLSQNFITDQTDKAREDAIRKINNQINNYTDYIDFYQKEIADIQQTAIRTLKKLAKLYSLAED